MSSLLRSDGLVSVDCGPDRRLVDGESGVSGPGSLDDYVLRVKIPVLVVHPTRTPFPYDHWGTVPTLGIKSFPPKMSPQSPEKTTGEVTPLNLKFSLGFDPHHRMDIRVEEHSESTLLVHSGPQTPTSLETNVVT